jgi:hypothetical protein
MTNKEFNRRMNRVIKETITRTQAGSIYPRPYTCGIMSVEFGIANEVTTAYRKFLGARFMSVNIANFYECHDKEVLLLRIFYLTMFQQELLNTSIVKRAF